MKFVWGFLAGIALIFVFTGLAFYFLVYSPGNHSEPVKLNGQTDQPATDAAKPPTKLEGNAILRLVFPGGTKAKFEKVLESNHSLAYLVYAASDPKTYINPKTPNTGHHVETLPDSRWPGTVSIKISDLVRGQDYMLRMSICPDSKTLCIGSNSMLDAVTYFYVPKDARGTLDLGTAYFTRNTKPYSSCKEHPVSVFAGKVIPTEDFPKQPPPGKKFALVIVGAFFTPNTPAEGMFTVEPKGGARQMFWNIVPPFENYLLYSGPFEAKSEGFAFSVPSRPTDQPDRVWLGVVECDAKADWKACGNQAFPIPVNFNSVEGRFYRAVPKDFDYPWSCGFENTTFYLHKFAPPGTKLGAVSAKLPPEVIEGAYY